MKKVHLLISCFLASFCITSLADTVTLKSGEKVEGRITSETDSQVTITIQVSASITDERIISRSDIQKIDKASEDDVAFAQLQSVRPDPMFAQENTVHQGIVSLNSFLKKYPQSPHAADVKAMLDVFEKEQSHLDAGDIKLFGAWVTPKEAAQRKAEVQAQDLYLKMVDQAGSGDLIGALNTLDEMQRSHDSTRAWPLAIGVAKGILPTLSAQVTTAAQNYQHDAAEWAKGIEITPEPQKSQTIAARKAEQDRYDAIVAGSKQKWPPFIAQGKKSLDTLTGLITNEAKELDGFNVNSMNASLAMVDKARAALALNDVTAAEGLLDEAKTQWPTNEEAIYLLGVIKHQEAEKKAAQAKPSAKPSASVAAHTPAPAASPAATVAVAATQPEATTPFYMTPAGAGAIVGGAVLLLLIVAMVQKANKAKGGQA